MKPFQLLASALAFIVADAYLVTPPGTVAPGAISTCSEWVQASYGMTCEIIHRLFGMTDTEFELWNPSVNQLGDGCNLISDLYYCVQINYATQTPTWTASTTTTTSTSAITTPTPTQTGMVSTCNDFYLVVSGDSCYDIATANAIALDDLYSWNPAVGTNCAGLWPDYYICVGVAGGSSATTTTIKTTITTTTTTTSKTTTTTGNGVATPTPTQANMASNCNAFYLVVSGDSCYDIAVANGIALADLYSWNPAVGTGCGGLWPDYYICVGLIGGSTPTTTTTTTTTKTGNGVTTPTPIQTGMVTTCKTFYLVVSGDGCYDIAAAAGVTLANFYAWNPAVGTNCASLWPDYYVCIGV